MLFRDEDGEGDGDGGRRRRGEKKRGKMLLHWNFGSFGVQWRYHYIIGEENTPLIESHWACVERSLQAADLPHIETGKIKLVSWS